MPKLTTECLSKFSKKNNFIESGTYQGDTVKIAIDFGFNKIHSIEIEENLYSSAVELFKKNNNVKIWNGDSPDALREHIIPTLSESSTFWLDAHKSRLLQTPGSNKYGSCPLLHELDAISESSIKNHVIIIDDVRLFGTQNWDFVKKEDCIKKIMKINPNYVLEYIDGRCPWQDIVLKNDILIAHISD
jgi:hypothetical protein